LLYDKFLADNYQTLLIIGVTFLFGAALIFFSNMAKKNQTKITYKKALVMGLAQGAAIFQDSPEVAQQYPAGLLQGVKREMVFKFSFLLSIPAIIGDFELNCTFRREAWFRKA